MLYGYQSVGSSKRPRSESGFWVFYAVGLLLPLLVNTLPGRGERQIMFIREEKQVAFWLPATRGLPS